VVAPYKGAYQAISQDEHVFKRNGQSREEMLKYPLFMKGEKNTKFHNCLYITVQKEGWRKVNGQII
jgi:L-serine deaminase